MTFTDSELSTLNVSDLSMVVRDSSFKGSSLLLGNSFAFCMSISFAPTFRVGVVRGVVSSAGVLDAKRIVGGAFVVVLVVVVVEAVVGLSVVVVVVVVGLCVVVVDVVVGFGVVVVVVVVVVVDFGVVVVVVVVGFVVVVVVEVCMDVVEDSGSSFLAEIPSPSFSRPELFPNVDLLVVVVGASLASPCLPIEVVAVVDACVNATEKAGFLAFWLALRRVVDLLRVGRAVVVVVVVVVLLVEVVLGLGVVVLGVGGGSVNIIGFVLILNIGS